MEIFPVKKHHQIHSQKMLISSLQNGNISSFKESRLGSWLPLGNLEIVFGQGILAQGNKADTQTLSGVSTGFRTSLLRTLKLEQIEIPALL